MNLDDLISKWLDIAEHKFRTAGEVETESCRKSIENIAFCYLGCARDLQELVKARDQARALDLEVVEKNAETPRD